MGSEMCIRDSAGPYGRAMDRDPPVLTVLGELVVDLLPVPGADAGPEGTAPHYVARPGGNALNVAVAAGRLGTPVALLARLGTGPMAPALRRHAELSGVDVSGMVAASEPVSLAVIGLGPDGSPDYGFHVQGAADWQWTDEELAAVLPPGTALLHVGSISSWTPPGGEAIARLAERYREARFSEHEVTEAHRAVAVAALDEIHASLRAPLRGGGR